jgi:hypothetical protein
MPAKGFVALVRLFLAAVLLTTLSRAASPALNPDFTDAVWIAESERVLKVTRAEGSVLFEIPEAGAVTVLGIDVERGILWAYGEGKLFRYDFAGQRHTVTPLSTALPQLDAEAILAEIDLDPSWAEISLALDPTTGSV